MRRIFLIILLMIVGGTLYAGASQLESRNSATRGGSGNVVISPFLSLLLHQTETSGELKALPGASPTQGYSPLTVLFTTDGEGSIVHYRWDFDGDASWDWEGGTKEDRSFTYLSAGSYQAQLQVEDEDGGTASAELRIVVTPPLPAPPTASLNSDKTLLIAGQSATLSWSTSGADSVSIDQGIGTVAAAGSLSVSPTETTTYTLTASNAGGTTTATVEIVVVDPVPEELVVYINQPGEGETVPGESVTVSGSVSSSTAQVWVNGQAAMVTGGTFSIDIDLDPGYNQINATASADTHTAFDSTWVIRDYTYMPQGDGSFGAGYEELIPDDASLPAYDEDRFAVITGTVEDEQATGIAGVSVTVLGHPEYGTASTDNAGLFSLAVEGDTRHTVVYQHDGYLSAQRKVEVPAGDVALAELVRLVIQDSVVTSVTFDANPETVITHTASTVNDSYGERGMSMVFRGDNQAWELDEHGQRIRPLTTIDTRATEFTTPEAMPAVLPANSAFTYCAELAVDGVDRIEFDSPVVTWVDNFLGFEVGTVVPVGYYDRDQGAWVPTEDGVVVMLLDNDNDGVVDSLDATGDGLRDDLNGDTDFTDEVAGLGDATRYPVGATFWRVEVSHFTPYDLNWPQGTPADAIRPNPKGAPDVDDQENPADDPCEDEVASSVEPQSRIFHEDIAIPGTELSLHYVSNRVDGYQTIINVPVSGATVPASLERIDVSLTVAGRMMEQSFAPQPDLQASFTWDGLDHLGKRVDWTATASIEINFVYPTYYQTASVSAAQGFSQPGDSLSAFPTREFFKAFKKWKISVQPPGGSDVNGWQLAEGWTLSDHHTVLPVDTTTMHKGDGTRVQNQVPVIETIAGNGEYHCADGGNLGVPATEAGFDDGLGPDGVVVDSKGNTYISVWGCESVYKIDPDGILTHFAGIEEERGFSGDGGPATSAMLAYPYGLAVDAEDNLYIAAQSNRRIRKVDQNGIITTVAGNGDWTGTTCSFNCEATDNTISHLNRDVEVDREGNIYIADAGNGGIGKVDANGIFHTFAGRCWATSGNCVDPADGDGLPATEVDFYPRALALGDDGSFYVTSDDDHYVAKIDANGTFHLLAGGDTYGGFSGDGGSARDALVFYPHGITLDPEGNIYFYDNGNKRIRRIDTLGIISTVAGTGIGGFSGDGGPASSAQIGEDWLYDSTNFCDLHYHDNKLYLADQDNGRLRVISLPEPTFETATDPGDLTFTEDNRLGYIFSAAGRHKKTIDLATGVVIKTFSYDVEGRLTAISDQFGNVTTIQYDTNNAPVSITSPDGLVTGLTLDGGNNLTRISYPGDEDYDFSYSAGSLLSTKTEPAGNVYSHGFDANGRLATVSDQEGCQWDYSYSRSVAADGSSSAQVETSEGNITSYASQPLDGGGSQSTITYPTGNNSTVTREADGLTRTANLACGMTQTTLSDTDPQYQTLYPQAIESVTLASLHRTVSSQRSYVDTNGDDLPDLISRTVDINGRTNTLVHDVLNAQQIMTSPVGRITTITYNPSTLLPVSYQVPGIHDHIYTHDARGRLSSLTQDTRSVSYNYDNDGFVQSITAPEGEVTRYSHDGVGRVTTVVHPDNDETLFAYDGNGNLTGLTTPSGDTHSFTYNNINKLNGYSLPGSGGSYSFSFDGEGQLTTMVFPSGGQLNNSHTNSLLTSSQVDSDVISISYLPGSRIDTMTRGSESISHTYDGRLLLSTSSTGTLAQTVSMVYDNDLLITGFSYGGASEVLSYDDDGLLIARGGFTVTRNIDNGLPELISDASLAQNRTFNGFAEISGESNLVDGSPVASWSVTRDGNGRITGKSETINGTSHSYTYTYDIRGRLLTVGRDGSPQESYSYDSNGNRLSDLAGAAYSYDEQDRLLNNGTATYTYSADGFLQSKVEGGNATLYGYSLRGELLSVTLPDATIVQYSYNPKGMRISKSIDTTVVEKYLWDNGGRLLAVYDASDTLETRFEYGDGRMPIAMTRGGIRYYLFYDQVGSLRIVSQEDGTVVKELEYDSFGPLPAGGAWFCWRPQRPRDRTRPLCPPRL